MEPGSKGRDHFTRPTYPDFKKFCHEFKCLISYVVVWEWCFSNLNNLSQYQTQSSILSSSKSTVGTNQQQIWAAKKEEDLEYWPWSDQNVFWQDWPLSDLPAHLRSKDPATKTNSQMVLFLAGWSTNYFIVWYFRNNRWEWPGVAGRCLG